MQKRYNAPTHTIPVKSYSDKDANKLTDAIIDCFDLNDGWATRISVEGRYIESLGHRIPSSVKLGTADIHAVHKGRHISIEIKMPGDRMSDRQIKVRQDIEKAGGYYVTVGSWNDFASFFDILQMGGQE
jgi:hypothetical protein